MRVHAISWRSAAKPDTPSTPPRARAGRVPAARVAPVREVRAARPHPRDRGALGRVSARRPRVARWHRAPGPRSPAPRWPTRPSADTTLAAMPMPVDIRDAHRRDQHEAREHARPTPRRRCWWHRAWRFAGVRRASRSRTSGWRGETWRPGQSPAAAPSAGTRATRTTGKSAPPAPSWYAHRKSGVSAAISHGQRECRDARRPARARRIRAAPAHA